jgi:hypothetical protein
MSMGKSTVTWLRWGQSLFLVTAMLIGLPAVAAFREEIRTPGGPLIIQQLDEGRLGTDFTVRLGQRVVIRAKEGDETTAFPDFPVPKLLQYAGESVPPFDAVAVVQQYNWGNACNGGPIWFLGIYKDGTFSASAPIDFCGGPSPQVSVTAGEVHIVLPASKAQGGSTLLPEEEWVFSGGKLQRIR